MQLTLAPHDIPFLVVCFPIVSRTRPASPAADEVVDRLGEECRSYKVGLELLTVAGPDLIESLVARGMMSAAVAAARDFPRLRVLALTVVTSMTNSDPSDIGVTGATSTAEQVLRRPGWRKLLVAMA